MRAAIAAASVALVFAGPAGAAEVMTSPATFSGAAFFPVEFVERVRTEGLAAVAATMGPPPAVFFVSPGEVELRGEEGTLRCRFTAEGSAYLWSLELSCPNGETATKQWTYLRSGNVVTDLIDVPGGELAQFELPPPPPPTAPVPPNPPAASTGARASSASAAASALNGKWLGPRGQTLEVTDGEKVVLSGHPGEARLSTCLHTQRSPPPSVPCVTFVDEAGKKTSFALLDGFAWIEGRIVAGAGGKPPGFEGWRGGRFFRREKPPQ